MKREWDLDSETSLLRLDTLPEDVIAGICAHLPINDFYALRSTCRAVRNTMRRRFGDGRKTIDYFIRRGSLFRSSTDGILRRYRLIAPIQRQIVMEENIKELYRNGRSTYPFAVISRAAFKRCVFLVRNAWGKKIAKIYRIVRSSEPTLYQLWIYEGTGATIRGFFLTNRYIFNLRKIEFDLSADFDAPNRSMFVAITYVMFRVVQRWYAANNLRFPPKTDIEQQDDEEWWSGITKRKHFCTLHAMRFIALFTEVIGPVFGIPVPEY